MKLSRVLISLVLFGMALVPAQAVTTVLSGVLTPEEAGFGWRSGAGTFQLELTGSRLNYFVSSHYVNSAEPTAVAMLGINLPTGRLDLAFTAHWRGWGTGCSFFSIYTPFSYLKPDNSYELPLVWFPQYDCDNIFDVSFFGGTVELTPHQQEAFLTADFTLDYNINQVPGMNISLRGRTDPNIFTPVPEPTAIILTGMGFSGYFFRRRWACGYK